MEQKDGKPKPPTVKIAPGVVFPEGVTPDDVVGALREQLAGAKERAIKLKHVAGVMLEQFGENVVIGLSLDDFKQLLEEVNELGLAGDELISTAVKDHADHIKILYRKAPRAHSN